VGRWGGDEFLVLLPDTDEAGARRVAGALLQAVRDVQLAQGASPIGITVSVGAATALPTSQADATRLIDLADEALYAAKGMGRNRVVAAASRG
jgi:diguanylate cyclase (GGDEF)-like protein